MYVAPKKKYGSKSECMHGVIDTFTIYMYVVLCVVYPIYIHIYILVCICIPGYKHNQPKYAIYQDLQLLNCSLNFRCTLSVRNRKCFCVPHFNVQHSKSHSLARSFAIFEIWRVRAWVFWCANAHFRLLSHYSFVVLMKTQWKIYEFPTNR